MKNQNIYKIPNKLVITTKKIVLLFFAILNVTSSNTDSFSENPPADSLSLPLNLPFLEQPTISNAVALIRMEEDKVEEGNSKKNEAFEEIQTKHAADEKLTETDFINFKSYVRTLIDKKLNIESQKKIYTFLSVYKSIITNYYKDFYFKIIDKNKFIIAFLRLTDTDSSDSDSSDSDISDSDSSDSDSSENNKVGLRSFMKRATKHYSEQQGDVEMYLEERAIAVFCDKDSGEMIIKFVKSIYETAKKCCDDKGNEIYYEEVYVIKSISSIIIDLINESSETLDSQKKKISYPICYRLHVEMYSQKYFDIPDLLIDHYTES